MGNLKKIIILASCLICFTGSAWGQILNFAAPQAQKSKLSPSYSWQEFIRVWEERRSLLQSGDFAAADKKLQQIMTMQEVSGWADLFVLGRVLRYEAQQQENGGQVARARLYLQVACAMAPHDIDNHLALASLNFRHSIGSPATYFGPLARAFDVVRGDWYQNLRVKGILFYYGLILLLAMGGVFLVIAYIRHGRIVFHDYGHLMPKGMPKFLRVLFLLLLLALPVLFRLGIFWCLLIYGFFIWWGLGKLERVAVSLLFLAQVAVAVLLPQVASYYGFMGSPRLDLYQVAMDPAVDANHSPLLKKEQTYRRHDLATAFTPEELYVLGLRSLKTGSLPGLGVQTTYEQGMKYLAQAVKEPRLAAVAYNAQAIGWNLLNNEESMIAAWNNSLQYDTALLETNFNLARYYYAHADTEKAEAYLRQASIKGGYVVDLNDMANKYDIFYLAYAPLTPQQVGAADKIEAYYVHEFLAPQLWQYLARGKRVVFILAAFGLWLLGFAITTFAKVRPASICQRCGDPACQKCQPELPDQKICEKCYRQAAQGGESARRHHHQYGVKSKKLRSGLIMTIIAVSFVTAGWLMAAGKNDPLLSQVVFSGSEAAWRPYREVFLQESLAGGQKVALSQALEAYYLTFGHYPLKLAELAESGFVSEVDLRWPWRAEYAYERYFVEKQQSLLNKQPPASWRLLTPVDNFQP